MENRSMINTYASWCRKCLACCCCGNEEEALQRKDIHYVLQETKEPKSGQVADSNQEMNAYSKESNENTLHEGEQLLKDTRSSSLKSEMYREIWQRRSVWIRQKTIPSFEIHPVEFWSGWNNGVGPQKIQQPTTDQETSTLKTPVRRKPLNLSHGLSVESLQPELYAQTSTESVSDSLDGDVEVISSAPINSPLGEIHFVVRYDFLKKNLLVQVAECRYLPLSANSTCEGRKSNSTRSHSYVKVCLLPNSRDSRQTAVHRKTQNPNFNQDFVFEVSEKDLVRSTLMLKIQAFDKYSRHHVIGEVQVMLCDVDLVQGIDTWRSIKPSNKDLPELGEILLSLSYLPSAKRLNLNILRGRQLLQTDLVGGAVPYVRVSLVVVGKLVKTKKTSFQKNTIDPVWGETISFNVAQAEIAELSLVVSVWDFNGGILKDDFIGRIVLGKHPTGDQEAAHWNNMLQVERSSVALWHTLRTREECDQVSEASIIVP